MGARERHFGVRDSPESQTCPPDFPKERQVFMFITSGTVSPVTSTHLFKSSGGLRSMRMRQIRIDDLQVPIGHLKRT